MARGISSDEVAIRLQNLHPSKPLTIDFSTLFSEGIEVSDLRERSLNLIYEVSEEKRKLRFKKDAVMRFDFTKEVKLKGEGGQNTDQEGVFLSDEAIAEMEKNAGGRKLLAIGGISPYTITLPATSIKSYFAAMTFSGKGFVPISKKDTVDEDTNNKEINDLGLEDDETVEETAEEEIRTAEEEDKKINIIEEKKEEKPIETRKIPAAQVPKPPREKVPFWVFVIVALLLAVCGFCCLSLTLMVRRRGRKDRPSVLPMFHQDNAGIKTK
ncbi:predicted protein [Naegleria gruberi]|uniref:Predicted protein n=1 Tax=Naegleria gruberi TaxID=5762 RepID=D2W3N1_NAEGR|nr:uncharacterized protein NAEGRDRAFT_54454 [Naegleria gruberi]EFC36363.1 predicted protein [Naegleria gruberi]|eukprot:XP_002669107.1 predicted protein [Naegleria gruberi strain NEG-M]